MPRRKTRNKKATRPLPVLQPLGNQLKRLRLERGLTQLTVAEAAGISAKYLGRVESAYMNPSAIVLLGLAKALGVTVGELFESSSPADGPHRLSPANIQELSAALDSLTLAVNRIASGEPPPLPKRAPARTR